MDASLKQLVCDYPIEAFILWSWLQKKSKILLVTECCTENLTRRQVGRLFYTALCCCNVFKLHQKDFSDVIVETSVAFNEFSEYLKLDGDYRGKNYVSSLLELSRLAVRSLIINVKKVPDKYSFNDVSKNLEIPNSLVDYISFK